MTKVGWYTIGTSTTLEPNKSLHALWCETRDFCTDACGGCVGHRASGEAVGLIRSTVRGNLLRTRLATRPHLSVDALGWVVGTARESVGRGRLCSQPA
jgi:hypothetical protein